MQAVTITQISPPELETLIENSIKKVLSNQKQEQPTPEPQDQLLSIDDASILLHLSKATVYSKVSRGELPGVCKQGKKLLFDRQIIIDWIKAGRKKSNTEIEAAAEDFVNKKKG